MARGDKGSRVQMPLGEGAAFEPVDYPAETVYSANASTCSDAAVSGPESVSNSEREVEKVTKIKYCSKCSAHNTKVQIANHKNKCPFKDCLCKHCIPIIMRRDSTALAQSDRRRKNPGKNAEKKPSKRKTPPKCTKCRIHGITVNFKGHTEKCETKTCTCPKCMVADERRFNTRTAQFRRRSQMTLNDKPKRISAASLPSVSNATSAVTPSTATAAASDMGQDPPIVKHTTHERDNCNESIPQQPTPSTPPEVTDKKPRQRSYVKRRSQTVLFSKIDISHSCDSKNSKNVFCDHYDERKTRRARRRLTTSSAAAAAAVAAAVDGTMTVVDSIGLKNFNNSVGSMSLATASSPPLTFPPTAAIGFPIVSPPAYTAKKIQFPPLKLTLLEENEFPCYSLRALCWDLNRNKSSKIKYDIDSYLLLYVILKHSNYNVVTALRIVDDKGSKDVLKNSVKVLGAHCRIKSDYYALLNTVLKISNLNVLTALRRIVEG